MDESTLMETTDEYWHKNHIAVSILLGIVVILSVVGNFIVIVTSIFYVRLRSLTSIFILNLALSDLLFTVGLPFWLTKRTKENSTLMETKVYSNDVDHYRAPSYSHATAFWIVVNKQITISILLGIVVLLSLVGNILVVVASVLYVRLRSLMSIFILNLALSDLLFTVGMLFWICDYIWHLDLGDTVCKMYRFFFSVGCYSNVVFQVLMSFQRYMAVVHPRTGNNTMMETIDGPRFGYSKYESSVLYSNKIMNNIHITIPIILSIFGLLSLIGNILVSVYTRLQSLTSIFILNLALSDLLLTIRLPFWVSDYIWRLDLGDSVCKVYNFLSSAGFYSSMLFLVLMSIQRYMIVVHSLSGLKEGHIVTDVLTCVWVMSVLAALPITMHFKAQHYLGGCSDLGLNSGKDNGNQHTNDDYRLLHLC
ncbi:hypothetical protein HF521_006333 [Silurus meridionalis]|uniref:G-protein coupled receptors family 1 profile domain-containing protein n=1 Tax=Silurus meridionalis TaxID=175797 RepID=A0A8T0AY84_SILME|nr:hypothetical protein HF521_006333 [Silurus meridionalis]